MPHVDLAFRVMGTTLPVDHGYTRSSPSGTRTLYEQLFAHSENSAGVKHELAQHRETSLSEPRAAAKKHFSADASSSPRLVRIHVMYRQRGYE